MSSTAIFGGTFNPVHNGHIKLATDVRKEFDIDRFIIMPSKIPPHKKADELADDNDRLNMCRLAFEHLNGFEVSDYEIKNSKISYTYYTLKYFKETFPLEKLYFVMGGDMLLSFTKWHRFEEVLSMASIIAASREMGQYAELLREAEKLRKYNSEIYIIKSEPFVVSSSEIREYVKNNKDISCYLPNKVVQYISENKIYEKMVEK